MKNLFWKTRRRKVGAALAVLALVAAAAGIAAWLVTVSNPPARGKFATVTVVAATPSAAPADACLPNSTCDGNLRLNNTSGTALVLTGFTAGSGTKSVTLNGGSGACIAPDISSTVSIPAKSGLNIPVPVGATDITIPDLFATGDVGTQCQGQDFTLDYSTDFVVTIST